VKKNMNSSLYTEKEKNVRRTWAIFIVFLIVVIGVGWIFAQALQDSSILYVAVIFSFLMNFFGYWYSDKLVLSMAGAKPVLAENNPELYRIVENLAITAGLPTPKIYLVPETAPNAFATGRNAEHAAIALTEGLLNKLDRSELEGVLAHELAHVGNRDILVGTVAVVLAGFIAILSDFFMRMNFSRSGDDDNGKAGAIFMVAAVVLSILAPIAAKLLRLSISRKREFLADSTGALLTRYPEGLARALEKISASSIQMRAANNSTAHLWVDDPFKGKNKTSFWHKIFMTHPPVEERIKALRGMDI